MAHLNTPHHTVDALQNAAKGARFAIVAARYHDDIVSRLVEGARDALLRHGAHASDIYVVRVPGSLELPLACQHLAQSRAFAGMVALGVVVRGDTTHFEHVSSESIRGCVQVSLATGVPIGVGVLTTENIEQAIERAGRDAGNKGFEAALSVIEMVNVIRGVSALKG